MQTPPKTHLYTTAELARRGMSRPERRTAVASGGLVKIRHGVYALGGAQSDDDAPGWFRRERDFAIRCRASARVVAEGTALSHQSALALYGLPLHRLRMDAVVVTRGRTVGGGRRARGIVCHSAPLGDSVMYVGGIAVTTPERTVVDVARNCGLEAAVAAADEALTRGLCTRAGLRAEVVAAKGRTGIGRARVAAEPVNPASESVLESVSRVVFHEAGLPAPQVQVIFPRPCGREARVDFFWPEFGIVGEADGLGKYGSDDAEVFDALRRQRGRQADLEALGYTVIRWTWAEVFDRDALVALVRHAIRTRTRAGLLAA